MSNTLFATFFILGLQLNIGQRNIMGNFKKLQGFVSEMKNTSSLNTKKEILGNYSTDNFITKVLEYTYNPYKQFNVTGKFYEHHLSMEQNELF